MAQLTPVTDPTGQMSQEEINTQAISLIMQEMNRGVDTTTIQRRSITPGQLRLLSYQPSPIQLLTTVGSGTITAGSLGLRVINFSNNGLTAAAGQSFLPIFYIDLFVDPSDTSSTANMYKNSAVNVYPDGTNVFSSGLIKLTFTWYLRNSTPGTTSDVVSYVVSVVNNDSSSHTYWVSIQLLLPADANLNNGNTAVYLP